jgi:type VI secretion system protein ImpJ
MSWRNKVVWREGLFLRPHHLQQQDRYAEWLMASRTGHVTPYPWGFVELEIDQDLAQQSKFALRRATGVMPDGTPFEIEGCKPPQPAPLDIPDSVGGRIVWLTLPVASPNTREVDYRTTDSASRFIESSVRIIDSTAEMRSEEEIDVAYPRLAFAVSRSPKHGYLNLALARIEEVREKCIYFDQKFAPPVLVCSAHPVVTGWLDRVIGWIDNKLEQLARFAADPSAGGGLQNVDYYVLQLLNRTIPVLKHLRGPLGDSRNGEPSRGSSYVHPERLYSVLLALAGELATYGAADRRARPYGPYDHDNLEKVFEPLLRDLQEFLSKDPGRPIHLELIARAANAFISPIRDRALFRHATFVLEVSARRPLSEIQLQFPNLLKVGPNTRMNEIVHSNLPGVPIVHMPTAPPQIRALTDHVYFYFDKTSPLWPEFSTAASIGLHFSGDWPELELDLWAIPEGRR